jgi:hypothetical protein
MTRGARREELPLVAVLYTVPLLGEAILSSLRDIAEVHCFPSRSLDSIGLLRAVMPDAVVVDDAGEAEVLRNWAEEKDLPLVHVRLRERKIDVLRSGEWEESIGASVDAIRNAVAGSLYARHAVET